MTTKPQNLLLLGAFVTMASAMHADVTLTFNNQTTFDAQWSQQETGGSSTISLTDNSGFVTLTAQGTGNVLAGVASDASLSTEFDFVSVGKIFTFEDVAFNFPDGGLAYNAAVGVASVQDADIVRTSGAQDSVYFQFNRTAGALDLIQKVNGSATTLATFGVNGYAYSSLSLTLTDSTWAVSGLATNAATISGSGNLATVISETSWGSDFYLAMESHSTDTLDRRGVFTIGQVSAISIPEPSAYSVGLGTLAGLFVIRRKHK